MQCKRAGSLACALLHPDTCNPALHAQGDSLPLTFALTKPSKVLKQMHVHPHTKTVPIHPNTHIHPMYPPTHTHIHTQAHTDTPLHTLTHTHDTPSTHTLTYTTLHTHTHTHTHTHETYKPSLSLSHTHTHTHATYRTPSITQSCGLVTLAKVAWAADWGNMHRCRGCWGMIWLEGSNSPGISATSTLPWPKKVVLSNYAADSPASAQCPCWPSGKPPILPYMVNIWDFPGISQ